MRILGGPCNVGSEPGPYKPGKVGMCVCVCVCICMYVSMYVCKYVVPSSFLYGSSPRKRGGGAIKLLNVFNLLIFFRLDMSCVDTEQCLPPVGRRREPVPADGMVSFVNMVPLNCHLFKMRRL